MAEEKRWLGLTAEQIEIYLAGGAEPGSTKHEQAKHAQQTRLAEQARSGRPSWGAVVVGVATVIGAVAAVIAIL
jgi:hypothetical protein